MSRAARAVGTNKEPPFTVLIVSEAELLVEIANDERNQHFKMEDTIGRLKDARLRLDKIVEELAGDRRRQDSARWRSGLRRFSIRL